MDILVVGGWHLALVTSAGLAARGHRVELMPENVSQWEAIVGGVLPIYEPGLDTSFWRSVENGSIVLVSPEATAKSSYDAVWLAIDAPLAADDTADVDYVINLSLLVLSRLAPDALIIVSSQLPVGSTNRIRGEMFEYDGLHRRFVTVPENLRLGGALSAFLEPDRIVVGADDAESLHLADSLLRSISDNLEVMSSKSAEMVKHGLNAFLGTSVAFANELARVCEASGADAQDVARGLMSDARIGPRAYIRPGAAFAGGTLGRDLHYLARASEEPGSLSRDFFSGVLLANEVHKSWPLRVLEEELGSTEGLRILLLGLTYKAETSTMRSSNSLWLANSLVQKGAIVSVARQTRVELPTDWDNRINALDLPYVDFEAFDAVLVSVASRSDLEFLENYLVASEGEGPLIVDFANALNPSLLIDKIKFRRVGRARQIGLIGGQV